MRIYKYDISLTDHVRLSLPKDARILDAQIQGARLRLWAVVDPDAPHETVEFRIIGTGHPIIDYRPDWGHVSTVQDREFVWHIFRVPSGEAQKERK
ncbi:MAG TPA: hypothetical protein VGM43_22900 [Bryobacteraceae bacterium]